ncbi:hypothetical protein [Carboxylicivirga sp. N1Y90]|uniref:hypothetical protein n=1 Tax=Carboxylicivirga fragile TaxID=3417571 RepID=UPI003D3391A3|nr:hypothetical protein [Marinilabiliaceae bacterium N1Y90]
MNRVKSNRIKCILIISVLFLVQTEVFAQGCSDAGFCTIHSLKPEASDSSKLSNNSFKVGTAYGMAQYNVSVITPYMEYTRSFGSVSLSAKLLMGVRSGDLSTTSGLSDIILTSTWTINPHWLLAGGIKLPFNKADETANGLPLPMAYQTSLGTTDMIVGATWKRNRLAISTAWQQALYQNSNQFLADDYPEGSLADPYLSTNGYHRSGDVLMRVSHYTQLSKKWMLSYSMLPIYHLKNDSYLDKNGLRQSIEKSRGLTLNLNTFVQYQLSEVSFIEFNVGAPVLARQNRPDGLNQFAVALEYGVKF